MALPEMLVAEPVPVQQDADGVWRISGTRVRLETVVNAFNAGISPEGIVLKYPSLSLPDVYAVVSYYLHHQAEVDAFIAEREQVREEARREDEERSGAAQIRERLLARAAARG